MEITLDEWDTHLASGQHLGNDPDVLELAEQLSDSRKLSVRDIHREGVRFESYSHVGRIALGRFQITITPKIRGLPLLRLLRYAYRLRHLKLRKDLPTALEQQTFVELLLRQLVTEAEELFSRGLYRTYRRRDERLGSPRGRIQLGEYVRGGRQAQATVPCTHFPRTPDTLLNRIVLSGLRLGATLTEDLDLRARLRRLADQFRHDVSTVPLSLSLIEDAATSISRLNKTYRPALELIRLLLEGMGGALSARDSEIELPGFLFDMNRFFQDLLSRFLRENLAGWDIREEYRLRDAVRYAPGQNPRNRRMPVPRPDFALIREGKVHAFFDAKYRDLWHNPLPRDMLYQLALYAMSNTREATTGRATILYPIVSSLEKPCPVPDQRLEILHPVTAQARAHITLRAVNLTRMADLVARKDTVHSRRKRQNFAIAVCTA